MTELMPGAVVPARKIEDDRAQVYVDNFKKILRAARLNNHYPDGRALAAHAGVLAPSVHRGLYAGLEIDERTGLPTYKEWTRAQTDVTLAPAQRGALGDPQILRSKAEAHPDSAHSRNFARYQYYADIEGTGLVPLGQMNVAVRRVDRERLEAHFHVVLDKLDATGVFVRYAIDIAQQGAQAIATVDQRDQAAQSESFHALIYQFTSLDAEFTFVKLASMAGLRVERVIKGTVGPFYLDWMEHPAGLHIPADGFVASFGLDMAAVDVEATRLNDPLATPGKETTRQTYDQLGQRLGYRVFKDRKFVCPHAQVTSVRAFCEQHGTKNVIYGV